MRDAASRALRARRLRFEKTVRKVATTLPPAVRSALDNVAIVIEDAPPPESDVLFGLYEGIPVAERGSHYTLVVPDRIILYRLPLEEEFGQGAELERQVRVTLLHEIGHHLGLDEAEIDQMGLA
jgi:predicted Zn-dependent protease with MMP-like domain